MLQYNLESFTINIFYNQTFSQNAYLDVKVLFNITIIRFIENIPLTDYVIFLKQFLNAKSITRLTHHNL